MTFERATIRRYLNPTFRRIRHRFPLNNGTGLREPSEEAAGVATRGRPPVLGRRAPPGPSEAAVWRTAQQGPSGMRLAEKTKLNYRKQTSIYSDRTNRAPAALPVRIPGGGRALASPWPWCSPTFPSGSRQLTAPGRPPQLLRSGPRSGREERRATGPSTSVPLVGRATGPESARTVLLRRVEPLPTCVL